MSDLLVLIDFSDVTPAVLQTAARLARALSARLALLHVAPADSAPPRQAAVPWRSIDLPGAQHPALAADQAHMPTHAHRTVYVPLVDTKPRPGAAQLQQQADRLHAEGLAVTALLVSGKPVERILEQAASLHPELIVLGSHGHGALRHLLLGSVAQAVLHKAPCPVVIVPSCPASLPAK